MVSNHAEANALHRNGNELSQKVSMLPHMSFIAKVFCKLYKINYLSDLVRLSEEGLIDKINRFTKYQPLSMLIDEMALFQRLEQVVKASGHSLGEKI